MLRRFVSTARENPALMAGVVGLFLIVAAALSADLVFDHPPMQIVGPPMRWPGTAGHMLGTDVLGRDILTDLVHAARTSLAVGLGTAMLALVLGVIGGSVAGYFGGWTDYLLNRLVEILQTLPTLVFAIVAAAVIGPSLFVIMATLALMSWPTIARLVRAEVLRLREAEFVQAVQIMGASHLFVLARHIIPNALSSSVATSAVLVANAILAESALSFLGLGDPSRPSWGGMIATGKDALRAAWFMAAIPGVAICATVVVLGLLGNGLNRALNPRSAE